MTADQERVRPSFFHRYGGLLFGLLIFVVVIGISLNIGEGKRFLSLLAGASPMWLLVAFVLQSGTYWSNAHMWHATLRRTETPVPFRRLVKLSVAKLFIDQAAPSGGLSGSLMVMESLAGKNIPRHTAIRALFVGLTGYYIAYAILFGSALIYMMTFGPIHRLVFWAAVVFGMFVFAFAAATLLVWFGAVRKLPRFITERRILQPFLNALHDTPNHITRDWRILLESTLAAGGIFLLDVLSLWAILHSLGIDLGGGRAFASFMISSVAMTIGLVPGGLGVFEGSSTAMLVFFGVEVGPALAATLILRGFTYWLPMIPGLLIAREELRRPKTPKDPAVQQGL